MPGDTLHINTKAVIQHSYDAIVVGTGISGGWAAKELCEKGLKVLLLERGRNVEHIKDYTNALKAPWELKHRNMVTTEIRQKFPIQSNEGNYPINESNQSFWQPDAENKYEQLKPFDWFRANNVGGRSLLWGRHSYRWSDVDFEANAKEGIAIDWPIRYKEIEPWYTYVEKFVGISGEKLGLAHFPDSDFLPAMEMNCVEKEVKKRLQQKYQSTRYFTIGRVAHITKEKAEYTSLGRATCQYRNNCSCGCPFGAYFSTQSATLPAAVRTGNLTLRTDAVVRKVLFDESKNKATGVEVIDVHTKEVVNYFSKIIFLNASTIASTQIMLNSTSNRFPNGLGNDSGVLGQNLMDHHSRVGASGNVEGFEDKYYYGRRANGIYIPRYRNLFGDKRNYLLGFGYQGGAGRNGWNRTAEETMIGVDLKETLSEPGNWTMSLSSFGECLPYSDNRIFLHQTKKDNFGLPILVFDCAYKENEFAMRKDMKADAAEMLAVAGVKNIHAHAMENVPMGLSKHEMGSARMGKDATTSVLNKHNQVWGCANVFVTDGACMTSSACQNPSLTYMALTARAANFAVNELKKQNL